MIMFTCIKKFLKKSGMTRSVMEMYARNIIKETCNLVLPSKTE